MPKYKVSFYQFVPNKYSVFVDDELDELDEEEVAWEGELLLRDYLRANDIDCADLEDPEVERLSD